MSESKRYTRKEVSVRNSQSDLVVIIENRVYDLTAFQDDHPGGHEVFLKAAGTDATEDFQDVGHSLDAKELMSKFCIGELVDEDWVEVKRPQVSWSESPSTAAPVAADSGFLSSWKFPVALGLLITLLYSYLLG